MGVLNKRDSFSRNPNDLDVLQLVESSSNCSSLDTVCSGSWSRKQKRQSRLIKRARNPVATDFSRSKKSNRIFFPEIGTVEEEDEDVALDIYDYVDSTKTPFSPIVEDMIKLEKWFQFNEMTIAEQERFLNDDAFVIIESDSMLPECVNCYLHINRKLRHGINWRRVDIEKIQKLEDELEDWFTEYPDSVLVKELMNNYERMLVHAACQYAHLISRSCTNANVRQTIITNPYNEFVFPKKKLSEYLIEMRLL